MIINQIQDTLRLYLTNGATNLEIFAVALYVLYFIVQYIRKLNFIVGATRIETQHGWLKIDGHNNIDLIEQIEKIPGLIYEIKREGFYDERTMVLVSNQVGKIIELYLEAKNYADMELYEFVSRMLPGQAG